MQIIKLFRYALIIIFLSILKISSAQTYEIGEWIDHISKRNVTMIDEHNGVIYAATRSAIFKYDTESGEFSTKTTVEGLSDVDITTIKYNKEHNFLMVGYSSGIIDFVKDNEVYTIVDVQQNSSLSSKTINNFHFAGDTAYVACDFGLLVINIPEKEIQSTYFLGSSQDAVVVKDVALGLDSVWVATDKGIYVASQAENNLHNFQNWNIIDTLLSQRTYFSFVEFIGDSIYCVGNSLDGDNDIVFLYKNGVFHELETPSPFYARRLDKRGKYYVLTGSYVTWFFNSQGGIISKSYFNGYENSWVSPGDAVILNDKIFYADVDAGLVQVAGNEEVSMYPNSPFANTIYRIVEKNGKIYVTGGTSGAKYKQYGMYIYDDYWFNINGTNNSGLKSIPNINFLAFEKGNGSRMYATSFGYGFLVFEDTSVVEFYNEDNSTLQNILGYPDVYIITTGLQADDDIGAWVLASGVPNPINYYNGTGEWSSYSLNNEISNSTVKRLKKMPWGDMWFTEEGSGMVVFDPEKLKSGETTDAYNKFSVRSSDGSSLTNIVTAFEVDQDGYVWFGMDEGGLAVFYNASSALENDISASRIIVEQGGIAQYLLENERVSAVAVDAGNRKWIGTETGGAFLISPDGTEQILNLNTSNSPLPSDFIRDIEVDEQNGIVYIGTEEGLMAYYVGVKESVAAVDELKVFPNPVYEHFNDLVQIEGLQNEMKIKIADVAGQIVFETKAIGGTAYWNMKDFNNVRVSTGVYMIYASSADGSQTVSGKIFVVSQ